MHRSDELPPTLSCCLTAEFRGRTRAIQHAGAQDLREHQAQLPAAKHFMRHGPLQRFVRRRGASHGLAKKEEVAAFVVTVYDFLGPKVARNKRDPLCRIAGVREV